MKKTALNELIFPMLAILTIWALIEGGIYLVRGYKLSMEELYTIRTVIVGFVIFEVCKYTVNVMLSKAALIRKNIKVK